jgi:hypothetical protein
MTTFDDERDDDALEPDELPSPRSKGNQPLLMAGIGLVLMLVGYAATTYEPAPTHGEQEPRRSAAERPHPPPYQLPGRLAIYGGVFLFATAGVQMYRSSPPPTKDGDEGE